MESYALDHVSEAMGKKASIVKIKPHNIDHNKIAILTMCYVLKS